MILSADRVWRRTLLEVQSDGAPCNSHGREVQELSPHTLCMDMDYPLASSDIKPVSVKYAFAEAAWVLAGDDSPDWVCRWAPRLKFFLNAATGKFDGAYGPPFVSQVENAIQRLKADAGTRQAGINIWRENPKTSSLDVPCTLSVFWHVREDRYLNCHVSMRSSDAWLGLPYDLFTYTMMSLHVLKRLRRDGDFSGIRLGALINHAYSRHYYTEASDVGLPAPESDRSLGALIMEQPRPIRHFDVARVLNDYRPVCDILKEELEAGRYEEWFIDGVKGVRK